ncbi:hypothetical protein EDD90_4199 [Streptomyces sp. Ag109_O5-1]|uniref:hypothetical protein n=1 Tax=Streptomyces sp. Ag109_O5-1 TaxID=1938851 RepID=UPI000F507D8D|nr:hypothetical protein [Streptomyces sp. Ag109_O5-1]RPE41121.1 hypothetical protein EDD90_4199 [Streptomyces sp. Ag109_O5-1]
MEQRIGANSKPLEGAGFDPAFIPGLTSPASAEPEDAAPEDAEAKVAEVKAPEVDEAAVEEAEAVAPEAEDAADDAEEEPAEGPVFEAADRRARIVADRSGVRLALDEEKCEFRWDEIGAVETEAPRFGKRFTITVHTPDRRWYPIEIEATARSRFKEWEEELDAVLDAYFDDGADASDDTDTDADEGREEARA